MFGRRRRKLMRQAIESAPRESLFPMPEMELMGGIDGAASRTVITRAELAARLEAEGGRLISPPPPTDPGK